MNDIDFEGCILSQQRLHPAMEPQDVIKLCYQISFGAEHMLADKEGALAGFLAEYDSVPAAPAPLFERISPEFCRVGIAAWKAEGLPAQWLFELFALTAQEHSDGEAAFLSRVSEAQWLAEHGAFGFGPEEWHKSCSEYISGGIRPIGHSESYRRAYHPAYRLAASRLIGLLPLLKKLAAMEGGVKIVAIDGRSAAGKSTLARELCSILGTDAVHTDDFFLPTGLRTPQRRSELGGNIHYERFIDEILPHIGHSDGFSYGVFDCSKMAIDGVRSIPASQWRVVEGAYSHHPRFGDYMSIRVFCDIGPDEQLLRITARNGEAAAERFASLWIPLEEQYIKAFGVKERADVVIGER